jgi:myxalamid-type polyketide synthase MxaB
MSKKPSAGRPPRNLNIVDVLRRHANRQANKTAFTLLKDGEGTGLPVTYGELHRRARAVAATLEARGSAGKPVMILQDDGLQYIASVLGCLMAGAVAVPAFGPRARRQAARLEGMIADCGARTALVSTPALNSRFWSRSWLEAIELVATDAIDPDVAQTWIEPELSPDSLALLQYTSGSTREPRGVMITHENLISNLALLDEQVGERSDRRAVQWLPLFHDMGLVTSLYFVYAGFHCVLIPPAHFTQKPLRWLSAISRHRASYSGGPNFAFDLCHQTIRDDELDGLDLSCWRFAFTGAEPVRHATLERFAEKFRRSGFQYRAFSPCYGLAEFTLAVTVGRRDQAPSVCTVDRAALSSNRVEPIGEAGRNGGLSLVGCGVPWGESQLAIVDPEKLVRLDDDRIGEIWVRGRSQSAGYWNRPEETERVLRVHLKGGEGPYVRTGDLGFMREGELFVTGRLKDLIIIWGANYLPQDIEWTVATSHPTLEAGLGAAFSVSEGEVERLVIVKEIAHRKASSFEDVFTAIRENLADEHELQAQAIVLVKMGSLPRTSSGKVQRHLCRRDFLEGGLRGVLAEWRSPLPTSGDTKESPVPKPDRNETEAAGERVLDAGPPVELSAEPHLEAARGGADRERATLRPGAAAIQDWLIEQIARRVGVSQSAIAVDQPFVSFGISSLQAVNLTAELGAWLGRPLEPALAWNYPTIRALSRHLAGEALDEEHLRDVPVEVRAEPMAVIGMACRFPGADTIQEFWSLLRNGGSGIAEIPSERWSVDDYFDPELDAPGMMVARWGGFVANVDQFDASFFGITPREAAHMDPQQSLLLEVCWEAFENAGLSRDRLSGSHTGVFLGIGTTDFAKMAMKHPGYRQWIDAYTGTGNALSIAANRVSYLFDLRGPSLAVDTACSSALVALHLACQSLSRDECSMAVVAGVNLIISPDAMVALSKARMLSPTGQCKVFDAKADGYVRGEGCGVVLLKSLADALKDGDEVLAVIRGTAVNQDGRTSGISAPNGLAQQAVIRSALRQAGVSPDEIGYVEAHGTGTPIGDPIEVDALAKVFSGRTRGAHPCYVGSVKANVGHLETAAGIVGIIKTVLMLQHEEIPPQRNLDQLNPHIKLEDSPFVISTELIPFPGPSTRFAGVSSFGFGGTNSHAILEAAPNRLRHEKESAADRPLHLLALSAHSEKALAQLASQYAAHLDAHPETSAADFCYSHNSGRTAFPHRMVARAIDSPSLSERLRRFASGERASGVESAHLSGQKDSTVAFLFTGQGSQYPGMSRLLYETQPTFRRAIDLCAELLKPCLDRPLVSVLYPASSETEPSIHETIYTQPALFAVEYALAELWSSFGVDAQALMGHSVGEYVAACRAGVFSLETALRLVAERARLMQSTSRDGRMAVVMTDEAEVRRLLSDVSGEVSIAAVNGPQNVVISGRADAVGRVASELEGRQIPVRGLTVSHAFHSQLMEPILEEFERFAGQFEYHAPLMPVVSNLSGRVVSEGETMGPSYWRRHLREPVRFFEGMKTLSQQGSNLFVELGPQPNLTSMGRACLPQPGLSWLVSLREGHDDWEVLLRSLGEAFLRGAAVNWSGFDRDYRRRRLSLPTYPFQRSRHWSEPKSPAAATGSLEMRPGAGRHPLLSGRLRSEVAVFETLLDLRSLRYLQDHRLQGSAILPATAYLEMALAAAALEFEGGRFVVENLSLQRMLFLSPETESVVQVIFSPLVSGEAAFRIVSQSGAKEGQGASGWTLLAVGSVRAQAAESADAPLPRADLAEIRGRCDEAISGDAYYEVLRERGYEYGPAFRGIEEIRCRDGEAIGRIRLPEGVARDDSYHVHPALLDACLQIGLKSESAEFQRATRTSTYVPMHFRRMTLYGKPGSEVWARSISRSKNDSDLEVREADLELFDPEGALLARLEGVQLRLLSGGAHGEQKGELDRLLYGIAWRSLESTNAGGALGSADAAGTWLLFADGTGVSERLAAALGKRSGDSVRVTSGGVYARVAPGHYRVRMDDPSDLKKLFAEVFSGERSPRGVVYLGILDAALCASEHEALEESERRLSEEALNLVQQLAAVPRPKATRLWMVTQGTQAVDGSSASVSLAQSPLWGLGRTVALEHPEWSCALIDLSPGEPSDDEIEALALELLREDESQIVLRDKERWAARLVRRSSEALGASRDERRLAPPSSESYRLEVSPSKTLESLTLRAAPREKPERGWVEVRVRASGLNFSDVLKAMGLYPGITDAVVPLGIECSGVVTAVGEGVTQVEAGDEVLGCLPYSFGAFALTPAYAVARKPSSMSFEEAATLPVAFLTAYYALSELGRIRRGERVLIHAGAGGVGLAAVQIAKHFGAEIFTTAGSPEKRDYLRSLDIQHVMSSRTLEFVDETLEITRGEGVDLVLNSLPGEAAVRSLQVLGTYGRFLEIGKIDIYQNRMIGLAPFKKNLAYFAIDMDQLFRQKPDVFGGLLKQVMDRVEAGDFKPLPYTMFPIEETIQAFRFMSQRRNIGKIVVSLASAAASAGEADRSGIRAEATYLLTGGLGAIGLSLARWLVERGARNLVLVSRRGPSGPAEEVVRELRRAGARVEVASVDVSDRQQVDALIERVSEQMPPLAGVFHAAGVLDDGILLQLDAARFRTVMAPKLRGAWNLHQAVREKELDYFVLFSSIASVLGSPGQGNYAAANAFLDALAHYRRSQSMPGLSINWGPWADAGMAARTADRRRTSQGLAPLPPEAALNALDALLGRDATSMTVAAVRVPELSASFGERIPPLFRELASESGSAWGRKSASAGGEPLRGELLSRPPGERRERLRSYLIDKLAQVIGCAPDQVDSHQPLNALGLDSLMSIELKNGVEAALGISMPIARFLEGPTLEQLADDALALLAQSGETGRGVATGHAPASPITRISREGELPLSFAQQRLWFVDQLLPRDNAVYNVPTAVRFEGEVNVPALRRTLEEIIDRHESLRTTFPTVNGRPVQVIAPSLPVVNSTVELQSLPLPEREAECQRLARAEARRPFDLSLGPLLRVTLLRLGAEDHVLLWTMHHIVADGWSTGVLIRDIAAVYRAYSRGLPSPLPELPIQYADFAHWQRRCLQEDVLEEQLSYWRRELADLPVLELPTDRPRPAMQTFRGARADFELGPSLLTALEALSEGAEVTLFMTVLAGFQTLLSRYSGQDDVVVGSAFANRNRSELEGLVGFLLNNLVLRTNLSGNPTFRELLPRVRERCLGAYAHQDIPFENLVEQLQTERDLSREPLFQVAITLEKGVTSESVSDDLTLSLLDVHTGTSKFDLTLFLWKGPERVTARVEYKTDLFDGSTIERLIGHFETLLEGVVEDPDRRLSELDLLTRPERHQLVLEWEAAAAESSAELTIPEWFGRQARLCPEAVAVVDSDRQLTYGALEARANRLAHYLRALGVGPDVRVGICIERSVEMVLGILGILKAGGAYVPLEPDYPPERLAFVLADSGAALVLTREALLARLPFPGVRAVSLESEWERIAAQPGSDPAVETGPANLAYVIYTSGSTGRPKGCLLSHRNVVRLLASTEAWFGFDDRDVWTLFHSYAFDFSVWEIWGSLLYGGRLVVVPYLVSRQPEDFHELLLSRAVTVLNQTPSSFYRLMEVETKRPELATLSSLRFVVFGGEALEVERLEPWFERHGERSPRLVNMYGITETTVHVTHGPLSAKDSRGDSRSPIGRQIPDLGSYVLDAQADPLPVGVAGELSVSGAGLARGYQNRADLTAERFVPHPFGALPGERLYRTGDLVRWLSDAKLEYLGRIDHQVKVRGFRIEPGEIESILRRHPGVHEAAVVARGDGPDPKQLVAYVVPNGGTRAELSELRSYLKTRLPEYMIPSSFVEMESLPLTANKKLDRKALPSPDRSRPEFEAAFVAPRTELEKRLARIWSEVLGVERLGIHDSFFDLGGHSLLATVMISRLKEELRVEVELNALFETPTVAGLSDALAAARRGVETPPIEVVSREMDLPLSYAQQRLWFLDQLAPENPVYNIPFAVRLEGGLDVLVLRRVFAEIVRRHESLRTTFSAVDGQPVQKIASWSRPAVPMVDLRELAEPEREAETGRLLRAEAHRPFDLREGPLLRVRLLRLGDEEHVVSLNVHHIVSDDWSMGVILREMTALYRAYRAGRPSPLKEPSIQYADYASWQRKWLSGELLNRQLDFWVGELEGASFDLALPTDRPRPKVQTFRGAAHPFGLSRELTESLSNLGRRHNASLFMTLLAAFQTLLSRYSGQDQICVGSPIAGRNRVETEALVGLFVNTLVLRGDLSGNPRFEELLARTREATLRAYAHQDLPFEQLVQRLQPERDMRRTPLFQVVLSLHNVPIPDLELPEISISPLAVASDTAKFDLVLELSESEAGLKGWLEYNTDLFDPPTIERMSGHFAALLERIVSDPGQRLLDIPFASTESGLLETPLHPTLDRDEAFDFGGFR